MSVGDSIIDSESISMAPELLSSKSKIQNRSTIFFYKPPTPATFRRIGPTLVSTLQIYKTIIHFQKSMPAPFLTQYTVEPWLNTTLVRSAAHSVFLIFRAQRSIAYRLNYKFHLYLGLKDRLPTDSTISFTAVDTSLLWKLFAWSSGVHVDEVLLYISI